ncbi:MAG: aminopeptidase N, partial [Pseudomonadota bacterium]
GTKVSPQSNSELMGLYRSNGVYCTQCEAEGFRRITYHYDRPDVLSVYTVKILADGATTPVLLSNGNLVEEGMEDGRAFALWHDPFPKPSYLFALVAGDLDVLKDTFRTMDGREVALAIYVETGKAPRAAYAMDALKRSMLWDEKRFGRAYDLDVFNIVAVSDFNMGAMENKGLNVFNDRYILADTAVATDVDYDGVEAVVAHEYFHNWTGNRITCRDWFQLCVKEGLTVFRDQEFTSDERSRAVKRIEDTRRLRQHQFREDASPLRHPVRPDSYAEISNLYTATVYEKGAEVIRMLHTLIGEAAFREGMDTYFDRHDGGAVTVEDFIGCFDALDVPDFMRWYEDAGTPTVTVTEEMNGDTYTLRLTQVPPEGARLKPIPLRTKLFGDNGPLDLGRATVDGARLMGDVLLLEGESATLTLPAVQAKPLASLLRGFSAPIRLERESDPARDLAALQKDDDPFNVWDAAQRLLMDWLTNAYEGTKGDVAPLADALSAIAREERYEPAFRALILTLPSRANVFDALGEDIDPDRVEAVHTDLATRLGTAMAPALKALLNADRPADDDVSAAAAGERALANGALALLTRSGDSGPALAQAEAAGNMTDRLAALSALAAANAPEADAALQSFRKAYDGEALVLDKYFILQALRADEAALSRTKSLMDDPHFSLSNPNRVRSLVGAFSQNPVGFHRADGEGYRFVADIAMALDGTNPQVAARLLTAFGDHRRFEEDRRRAARAVLDEVAAKPTSADVADIARRLTADR